VALGLRRIASSAGHVSKATFGCFEPRRSADAGGAVFLFSHKVTIADEHLSIAFKTKVF